MKCYAVTEPIFNMKSTLLLGVMPIYVGLKMTSLAADPRQQVALFINYDDAEKFAQGIKNDHYAIGIMTLSVIDAKLIEEINAAKNTGVKISLDPKKTLLLSGKCTRLDSSSYEIATPLPGLEEKLTSNKPMQQKIAAYFRHYFESNNIFYLFFRDHKDLAKEIVTHLEDKNIQYNDQQVIDYLTGKLDFLLKESFNNVTKAFYKTLAYAIHKIHDALTNTKVKAQSVKQFRAACWERMQTELSVEHPFAVLAKKARPPAQLLPANLLIKQLKALERYPDAELYRLIVDGVYHKEEQGWLGYEKREPGCLKAGFNALGIAFSNLENPEVNLDLLLRIFQAFTDNVALDTPGLPDENEVPMPHFRPASFTPASSLYLQWATEAGILELLNQMEKEHHYPSEEGSVLLPTQPPRFSLFMRAEPPEPNFALAIHAHNLAAMRAARKCRDNQALAKEIFAVMKAKPQSPWFMLPPCGPTFVKEIEKLLEAFNRQINIAPSQESKLELIVGLAYDLEHNHIFKDANLRTTVIGLMNRLLLQHGFTVCTHEQPNIFEGHSKNELVAKVKEAMRTTEKILNGEKTIFDFQSSNIPVAKQQEYLVMISGLKEFLASEQARLQTLNSSHNNLDSPHHRAGDLANSRAEPQATGGRASNQATLVKNSIFTTQVGNGPDPIFPLLPSYAS